MAEEVASALAQCSDWQAMTRTASKIFLDMNNQAVVAVSVTA